MADFPAIFWMLGFMTGVIVSGCLIYKAFKVLFKGLVWVKNQITGGKHGR